MKVSVSIRTEDLEFLDTYARTRGMPSRSAAVAEAVAALRAAQLAGDYAQAFAEWSDEPAWERGGHDGL